MIYLSVPNLSGNEWDDVKDCLDSGWISTAGAHVGRFEREMAAIFGVRHAIFCMDGTAALRLAMRLNGVSQGNAVLVPNLAFVATSNPIVYAGDVLVLIDADVRLGSWTSIRLSSTCETPRPGLGERH